MLFAASIALVFGAVGVFLAVVMAGGAGLPPGSAAVVGSETPWLLVAALSAGAVCGLAALFRRRTRLRGTVVALELALVALSFHVFFNMLALPPHELAVSVGDAFPRYVLSDQDGTLREGPVDGSENAKLFVFYRGDW